MNLEKEQNKTNKKSLPRSDRMVRGQTNHHFNWSNTFFMSCGQKMNE